MRVHAEPKPLDEPLGGGSGGATVSVEPLHGGSIHAPPGLLERTDGRFQTLRVLGVGTPRSRWSLVPCTAFLIRHPSAGALLVDTGLHPSVATKPRENLGRLVARFGRPELEPGRDVPAQLRARGIDPKTKLRAVVMTHLHYDHASAISEFPGSTFVISEEEWVAATTEGRPMLHGYRRRHFDYALDYRLVDYERNEISSYSTFGRSFDLFGDGSVRLAFTPGHSAGHQSVIARLRQREFVIAGDAVYTMRQLEGGPEQGRPVDRHTWRRSRQELQLFHREYPDAVIVPSHDAELWERLDKRYE